MELNATTLIFEGVNFIVLTLVLWRVLYRPLREMIEARQAKIREDIDAATALREEAEALQVSWKERDAELSTIRETVRREAVDLAEAERSRILERAREEASAEHARVNQLLEAEREATEAWVRTHAWSRGTELAGRMLLALAPEEAERALGQRLVEVLETNITDALEPLGDDPHPRVVISGVRTPDEGLVESVRGVFVRAGRRPRVTSMEDPALIAGWTVRIGDRLFDGSVAGQLAAFRELAQQIEAASERD